MSHGGARRGVRSRRQFLSTLTGVVASALLGAPLIAPAAVPVARRDPGRTFQPEYAASLDRVFFVWGQVDSRYQFREIVQICAHLPAGAEVVVLAPERLAGAARRGFAAHGVNAHIVPCPADASWHWGRDVGQLAWPGGQRALLVPWNKTAQRAGELVHNARTLTGLRPLGVQVRQAPLSFEGGNCALDRIDGETVALVGNSAILDTMALHRLWTGARLSFPEARERFRRAFGVDRVVSLGRHGQGHPLAQARYVFHIDMLMAIVAEGTVVVQRFDATAATREVLRREVLGELEASLMTAAGRHAVTRAARRRGIRAKLPVTSAEVAAHANLVVGQEHVALREAEDECRAVERSLRRLGYRVHTLESDWRHVRRFQALTNVVPSRDRLIMPTFPEDEGLVAYSLPLGNGRRMAAIHARPASHGQHYALTGVNRRAYELYRRLVPEVRVVEDRFYLTGGNVHCVLGRT